MLTLYVKKATDRNVGQIRFYLSTLSLSKKKWARMVSRWNGDDDE